MAIHYNDMEETNAFEAVKEKLIEYLTVKKLRKTPERFAILQQIYMLESHFDIETLYDIMLKSGYRVSRATVYNTVDLLVECHLIRKHQFGTTMAHYEQSLNSTNHLHMICTKCNRIEELCDEELQDHVMAKKYGHFALESFNLYMYGLCQECQKVVAIKK